MPTNRVETIPIGVNASQFNPVTVATRRQVKVKLLEAHSRTMVALSVLPLRESARPHLVIDALERATTDLLTLPEWDRPYDDIMAVVVGQGDLHANLTDSIARSPYASRIRLLPSVGSLHAYMRAADVYFRPSLEGNFPLSMAEAMAMGLPVVASAVGAVSDHVGAGATLVPAAGSDEVDAQGLADALVDLARDPAHAHSLGSAAREHIRRTFDRERMLPQVVRARDRARADRRRRSTSLGTTPNPSTAFGLLYVGVRDRMISDVGVVQSRMAEVRHLRGL